MPNLRPVSIFGSDTSPSASGLNIGSPKPPKRREIVYRLRYEAYVRNGLIAAARRDRIRDAKYDDAPNAWITRPILTASLRRRRESISGTARRPCSRRLASSPSDRRIFAPASGSSNSPARPPARSFEAIPRITLYGHASRLHRGASISRPIMRSRRRAPNIWRSTVGYSTTSRGASRARTRTSRPRSPAWGSTSRLFGAGRTAAPLLPLDPEGARGAFRDGRAAARRSLVG